MNLNLRSLYSGRGRKRWAAFFVGAALVLSFEPFSQVWLAPLTIACLFLLWEACVPREAAWVGFCFGLGLFSAGTYWLYISLNILGGLWPPIALLLMFGLIAIMAAYVAVTGYLAAHVAPDRGLLRWLLVLPAAWVLTEWLRGWLFTGFPWLSIGYSQTETPLAAVAPVLGVYGVSWLTACVAGLIVAIVQGALTLRLFALAAGGILFAGLVNLQSVVWTDRAAEPLQVSLVQGAIPQELKWQPQQLEPTLDLYTQLSIDQGPRDLIVWPEAAIPALPFEIPEYLDTLHEAMVNAETQLFAGILTFDTERREYKNTLWAMGAEQGQYHKRHLVAFGEFFPLPDFALRLLRIMNLPSESIAPGAEDQRLLRAQGVPVAATICYEIAFGAEQLQFFPAAQLMVNVSNDAWFGDSIAPHQHLQIGQMRALEAGRYLLRATNTGITAVISPRGQVQARIPQFESGVLNAEVWPQTGATPYVRMGNWPPVAAASLILLAAGLFRLRPSSGTA